MTCTSKKECACHENKLNKIYEHDTPCCESMKRKRVLTKRELRNELFGILSMCNGFSEIGHVGGRRQEEMIIYLPHQIAIRIMELQ